MEPVMQEFRNAIKAVGLEPPDVIEPGRLHRFSTNGRPGDSAGWCKLFPDMLGGIFGDFRTGLYEVWQAKRDRPFTAAEREAFRQRCEQERREREAEQERRHAEAAKEAAKIFDAASGDPDSHPYSKDKFIPLGDLVKRGRWPQRGWEDALLVPLYDVKGKMWTLEAIDADGSKDKDFLWGGKNAVVFIRSARYAMQN
ncbi:MAG: hypothetical protein O7B35_01130 [Deltaproteobacteria bacterium]|nr:hypothetical protein [Deltaproteobacteria bacterium]